MRTHKPLTAHPAEQPVELPEHPLIEHQHTFGNQAVLRMLGRGPTIERESHDGKKSLKEQAEDYIRQQIEYREKLIRRAFETIENNLMAEERAQKLPLVQNTKNVFLATDILTLSMIDTLHNAIKPVKVADYIDQQFDFLWKDIKARDEMLEALNDDPVQWQRDYLKKLSGH